MNILKYVETNLVAISILVVILFRFHTDRVNKGIPGRLFLYMVYSAIGALALDSAAWLLDGMQGPAGVPLVSAANALQYAVNPITTFLWLFYLDYEIHADSRRLRRMLPFLGALGAANTILSLAAPFAGGFFYVDGQARYHRGPLYPVANILFFCLLIYGFLQIQANRKNIPRRHLATLLAYSLPPIVGAVIQSQFYGMSLIWPCTAVSLLIVYTGIQNQQITTDYLTGLYNRRELDRNLQRRMRDLRSGSVLGVLMLDVDNFKQINDQLGHAVGDLALETMGNLLRRCFHHEDLLARYGGDEFVCVLEMRQAADLDVAIKRLSDQLEVHNRMNPEPCQLNISLGGVIYDPAAPMTADALLELADKSMYQAKERNKCKKTTT